MVPGNESKAAADELERFLIAELARRIEIDPQFIDARQPFERYGLDSLNAVRLAVELEQRIGCKLPSTLLWDYPSIESLARYLAYDLNIREIRPSPADEFQRSAGPD
jgi:acyl carrier protein